MGENQVIAVDAALSAFSDASQYNRLMQLDFPLKDGPPAILLPNKLVAHEEVSRSFRFDVEVLSDDPRVPLKKLMGRMVTISLVREDGSLRYFNGYITEFRFLRSDGGFAFYKMVLEPWLAFARLRKDSKSFHNKNVLNITEETLRHYPQAEWDMTLTGDDPQLTVANQYNETDYNHLHRRWEALGLHYWYEHKFDGHKLTISDNSSLANPIDEEAYVISFHGGGGSREDDGIHTWTAIRRLGSGKTTLASFDYKNPRAQHAEALSLNQQGNVFPYEIYEDTGAYGFRLHNDGVQLASRRMDETDKETQYFEAAGNERSVLPGRTFKLGGHFSAEPRSRRYNAESRSSIADRYYLILSADHEVSNNYQIGPGAPSHYENRFTCIRQDIRWRPGRNYHSDPVLYTGLHTAIVVGPAGTDIHTDGHGRVKLQLHWDRLGNYDERSSPWIRVMTPAAGSEFGQIRLPRVGEEVAVVYPNGNIDHPLVLGTLYNQTHMPPWVLPEQQSLTGLRSRELGGGTRGNQLVLDDTKGKIQAQLRSDHQCSQLSLGHITRIEDTSGRKDSRGEGWELRTDGHGVARAAKGLLITTEAREAGRGPIKDMDETSDRLTRAAEQHGLLADVAQNNGGHDAGNNQADVAADIKAQTEAVRGKAATAGSFSELSSPHLVMASPAGIATTSGRDTHIVSERHTAITSGKDVSVVAGTSLFASIHQAFRLFVQKAGMKLIASAGDVDVQALSNSIKLLAKLEISLEANRIKISAKEEVVIIGDGSYAKFRAGAIEFGTAGSFTAHAAKHSFSSAKRMGVDSVSSALTASTAGLDAVPPETGEAWVEFELVDQDGAIPGERFVLTDPSGTQHCGNVDERGGARIERLPEGRCKVEFPDLSYSIEVETT